MIVRPILIAVIALVTCVYVNAQGYMADSEFSGKHFQLRSLENRHSQTYEFMAGYTSRGRLSISLGLGQTSFHISDISGFSFSTKVSAIILKQERLMPLSLGVNVDVQKGFIESEMPKEDSPVSQFSLSLHHAYRGIDKMQFIPSVEIGYRQDVSRPYRDYELQTDYFTSVSLTIGYIYFYIEPKLVLHDKQKLFQLTAGAFIP